MEMTEMENKTITMPYSEYVEILETIKKKEEDYQDLLERHFEMRKRFVNLFRENIRLREKNELLRKRKWWQIWKRKL